MARRNNDKYFPIVFFVLFPLAAVCSVIEFGMFSGNATYGFAVGITLGSICYTVWKRILRESR